MMSVAILGLAAYPEDCVWHNVELLVRSARRQSSRTPIVLLTAPLGNFDQRLFKRFGVEAIESVTPPPIPVPDPAAAVAAQKAWSLELYGRRHALYRDVIGARDESHFLLTDTRDVIITAPLEGYAIDSRLVLSQEHEKTSLATQHVNREWVLAGYGDVGLAAIGDKPILCAGTVFGSRQLVDAYLIAMSDEVRRLGVDMTRRIGDQPLHNHLAYSGTLPAFEVSTAENGWMRAVGVMPIDAIRIDWGGKRYQVPATQPCAVVHQYDRHLGSRRMRRAVADAAGLPIYHRWRFDAYRYHGVGVLPSMLRPVLHLAGTIKRHVLRRTANKR
jgi:hypothetical protein